MWETGALHVLLPALAIHLDDDSREARQLWGRLSAIDTLHRADALPPDPVLFAALLLGPIEDAMRDAKNPTEEYEALMTEVLDTLAVPKRMKERIRNVVLTQRRLDAGRIRGLQRREYFQDAATLFAIRCDGRGQRRPEWLDAVASAEESPRPRRRRRRQRR